MGRRGVYVLVTTTLGNSESACLNPFLRERERERERDCCKSLFMRMSNVTLQRLVIFVCWLKNFVICMFAYIFIHI